MNPFALIKAALEDSTGGTSSMRLMCIVLLTAVLAAWLIACVHAGVVVPIGETEMKLLLLAFGAKAGQRMVEKPAGDQPPNPP